ncbi:hypothetical protein D3C75_654350 [compost metagenome]
MRSLQQRQFRVLQERTDGRLQENTRGDVVAVKHADQLTFGEFHGVVEVPGFSMRVIVTRDVTHARICGKHRKLASFTIIEQVDFNLVARVIDTLRSQHGIAHHFEAFVITGDVNIHRRPGRSIIRQRHNSPF